MKRRIYIGVVMTILVGLHVSAYEGVNQEKAQALLEKAKAGGEFAPVVAVPSEKNTKGKSTVYEHEYGVFIKVDAAHQDLLQLIDQVNAAAYPHEDQRPHVTPHITLVQGVFKGEDLKKLKWEVMCLAKMTHPFEIEFEDQFVKGGGGNTFLDVAPHAACLAHLNGLNTSLTEKAPPTGPMKQVIDAVRTGEADLDQMEPGKAWRDFNIPGSNRPHITAVYSKQDQALLTKSNDLLFQKFQGKKPMIIAKSLVIGKIDERGNIYEIVEEIPFGGNTLMTFEKN